MSENVKFLLLSIAHIMVVVTSPGAGLLFTILITSPRTFASASNIETEIILVFTANFLLFLPAIVMGFLTVPLWYMMSRWKNSLVNLVVAAILGGSCAMVACSFFSRQRSSELVSLRVGGTLAGVLVGILLAIMWRTAFPKLSAEQSEAESVEG